MSTPVIFTVRTLDSNFDVVYITEEGSIQTVYSNIFIGPSLPYVAFGTNGQSLLFASYSGGNTYLATTTNGTTWSNVSTNGLDNVPFGHKIAWNGTTWLLKTDFYDPISELFYFKPYLSSDGVTWTSGINSNLIYINEIQGSTGLFYGGGGGLSTYTDSNTNAITTLTFVTSPDGITWTSDTSLYNSLSSLSASNTVELNYIYYNGNTWLAIIGVSPVSGESSFYRTLTSTNLSTWSMSSNFYQVLNNPTFNNNLWVLCSDSVYILQPDPEVLSSNLSQILYSSNGLNWTEVTSLNSLNPGGYIDNVIWNGSKWVATGGSTKDQFGKVRIFYSSNAITWSASPINSSNIPLLTYDENQNEISSFNHGSPVNFSIPNPSSNTLSSNVMVFAENSGLEIPRPTKMLYSTDGLNFQDSGFFVGSTIYFIETNGSNILVSHNISSVGGVLSRTTDGSNWSDVLTLGVGSYIGGAGWNGSKWFAITYVTSNDSYSGYTSTDGESWSTVPYSNAFLDMGIVRGIPGLFVGVRSSGRVSASNGLLQTSSDGINWTPNTSLNSLPALVDLQYNGSMWLLCSSATDISTVNTYTSSNLSNWATSTDIRTSAPMASLNSIAWNSNLWVIGGGGGNADQLAYSSNGSNWTAASSLSTLNPGGYIFKVIWNGSQWVASAHNNESYIRSYYSSDAITWEEFPITINSPEMNGNAFITSFYYPYVNSNSNTNSNSSGFTYESALSNAVPSDSNDKAAYFAALTNYFINYSSSTAVTVTNSNLVNYYRSQGSTIPIGGSVRFLPTNSSRVVAESVITSLSNGDYVIFPDNYTITIASKTYSISGNNLIITTGGVPATIAPNGAFTIYNKIFRFLTASSPGLGEVTGTIMTFTYESALSNAVPSDSNDKAAYFAAITNNFSNYSSSTAVTVTSSNLVNYYISQGASIPVDSALRFLPTNSSRVVSQAVITSLSVGDYVVFPDNYTIIISGKTYATSGNSLVITTSGVPATIAAGEEFTVYNKTLQFVTASSPAVTVVTASASNPNPPCFLQGTKILCLIDEKEQYITIESLTKGTLVKIKGIGYKPVTHLGYSKMNNSGAATRERNQLYVCSPDKYPTLTEPLYITGCHSILVDELTAKQREETIKVYGRLFETQITYRLEAYLDERAEPWLENGEFTVWHVALEHAKERWNWGIYANGLLVESISNHSILTSKTLSLVF